MKATQSAFPHAREQQRCDDEDGPKSDSDYISTMEALCYVLGTTLAAWAICGLVKFLLRAY